MTSSLRSLIDFLLAISRSKGPADQSHGIPGDRCGGVHAGAVDTSGERARDHWWDTQGVFGAEEARDQAENGMKKRVVKGREEGMGGMVGGSREEKGGAREELNN